MEKHGVRIVSLKRLNLSKKGNPRFLVTLDDGTEAQTEVDGAVNYGIENSEFRGVPLTVEFSRGGRITHISVEK